MPAHLFIEQGPRSGTRHDLDASVLVAGRDAECTLLLPDAFISRRQFQIEHVGGRFVLANLAARHATLLNGSAEPGRVPLEHGDVIEVGATRIRFRDGGARDERTPTATEIVGTSWQTERLRELVRKAAATSAPVLLRGQRGAGKSLVAHAIHAPLTVVRCSIAGAFAGASAGAMYLEDVDQLAAEEQAKLLALLETGEVRVIAGTTRDLGDMVGAGTFRLDLATRLATFPIEITPLCVRKDDIEALARAILRRYEERLGSPLSFTPDALEKLRAHEWPGNVSELRAVLQRTVIFHPTPELDAHAIKLDRQPVGELEREHVERALASANGEKRATAAALGISRSALHEYLERFDLS